jgi:hypothetical protein
MATTKKYELTPEHREQLAPWRDRWIAIALRTQPQDETDREVMRGAMRGLYEAANLEAPSREIFCPSPISAALATTLASCVWWLRRNPTRHAALFGRVISEREIMAGALEAGRLAVERGQSILRGVPLPAVKVARVSAATDAATDAATYAATDAATDRRDLRRDPTPRPDAATRRRDQTPRPSAATRRRDRRRDLRRDLAPRPDAATRAATSDATDAATYAAT